MSRVVVINSYEGIKEALVTKGTDFGGRSHESIPVGIVTNNFKVIGLMDYSKQWLFLRKLAFKSLHLYGAGMTNIEDVVVEETEKMCSILSKEVGKPICIDQFLGTYLESMFSFLIFNKSEWRLSKNAFIYFPGNSLVNTICHLCFSKKYNSDDQEFQLIMEAMERTDKGMALDQPIAVFPWLRFFPDTETFKNLKLATKFNNEYIHKMFQEHIESYNPEKIRDVTDNLLYLSQKKDIWEEAGFEEVTGQQLEAIVHTLFLGGFETSLTSLQWFVIFLIHYPEIQTKIYQQVVDNVGLQRQTVADDKERLPYVEAAILELQRCASIAPLSFPHKALVDSSVGGQFISKGSQVLFNIYHIHNDPTHWNEPEKFKPERWLNHDGSLKKEKATHYFPFGAGTRGCLGKRMANIQMFLVVTRLLTNFEVSLAPGEPMPDLKDGNMGMTFKHKNKFKIILKQRKH
ncbi:steroid 17-alpha-hydroxylase/17,20 lyase-like [Clytia hemisphaerica]|uniref:steroid 17-alpha-hydroxylase/17,20 lyase-like n=1 Tax=Clytia hemisphaerica TaxID=252671 RepID=UPI0034D491D3